MPKVCPILPDAEEIDYYDPNCLGWLSHRDACSDYRAHAGRKNDPFAFGTPGHTQATMMCGTGSDRDNYHYLHGVLDG